MSRCPEEAVCASYAIPSYWRRLLDPDVKTVFLTGCGGGFDFVHSMTILPELVRAGKKCVIGSYSFGNPESTRGGTTFHYSSDYEAQCVVKLVDATCDAPRSYGPEVGLCSFLDGKYPQNGPHKIYAFYARAFTVPALRELYVRICEHHAIDAVCAFDGGSDSLMAGDEAGLGDPIEDAVTVATLAELKASLPRIRSVTLVSIGMGCDRFNGVSDAATFRAIAEITQLGGFLGVSSVDQSTALGMFYREAIEHLQNCAFFRSVIANSIVESGAGAFGAEVVPRSLQKRVLPGQLFIWPLMSIHWAFDACVVFKRSLLAPKLVGCTTVSACYHTLNELRESVAVHKEQSPQWA